MHVGIVNDTCGLAIGSDWELTYVLSNCESHKNFHFKFHNRRSDANDKRSK